MFLRNAPVYSLALAMACFRALTTNEFKHYLDGFNQARGRTYCGKFATFCWNQDLRKICLGTLAEYQDVLEVKFRLFWKSELETNDMELAAQHLLFREKWNGKIYNKQGRVVSSSKRRRQDHTNGSAHILFLSHEGLPNLHG